MKNGFGDEKLRNDLDSINSNRRTCGDEASTMAKGLEKLRDDCKTLNDEIAEVNKKLEAAEEETDSLNGVATDPETMKAQTNDVKVKLEFNEYCCLSRRKMYSFDEGHCRSAGWG